MRTMAWLLIAGFLAAAPWTGVRAQELWCWEGDEIAAVVDGSTIRLFHDAALYNCCPEPFVYEVDLIGQEIFVHEVEVLVTPCYCICCYDMRTSIEDVPAGDYQLHFDWFDYESDDWVERVLEVSVPEIGQAGPWQLGSVFDSGCVAAAGVPEEEPDDPESPTWGRLKALFR